MDKAKRLYEAQIKSLQEEIAALQEHDDRTEQEMSVQFGGIMQDALLTLSGHAQQKPASNRDTLSQLTAVVGRMEEDLVRQNTMNRVDFTSCTVRTLERCDSRKVQQHRLTGHCRKQSFQIEFEITDVTEGEDVSRTVTELNIVMECSEFKPLSTFVSRVEDKKDLLLFFRTLRVFVQRCEERCRAFQHFRNKYPALVSLPGGRRSEVMKIQNPLLPGCALLIYWDISVGLEGVVTPKLDLLVKMPQAALQLDRRGSMKKAPQAFHSLLRLLGPEAAMESLILALG